MPARLGTIAVLVIIVAVAPAYARADSCRCDMRACADPMPINPAAHTDRPDMRAGFNTAITNAGTSSYDRTSMAASSYAVAVRARARANTADMSARTDAMFACMRIYSNAQYFDIRSDGIRGDRCKK